jgi:hypothetical protein
MGNQVKWQRGDSRVLLILSLVQFVLAQLVFSAYFITGFHNAPHAIQAEVAHHPGPVRVNRFMVHEPDWLKHVGEAVRFGFPVDISLCNNAD